MSIRSNWRRYFIDRNEGLGTTYERFILHKYFADLRKEYSVNSVLEAPSFGMTGISGINSLWWAAQGIPVTVVDDDEERLHAISKVWREIPLNGRLVCCRDYGNLPFSDKSFDLGWNFAALWFVKDLPEFLGELTRISKKAIFICVPNRTGLGFIARRIACKQNESGLFVGNINVKRIEEIIFKNGWKVVRSGFLDVPPWPDIAMKKEDLLEKFGLGFAAGMLGERAGNGFGVLDFFGGTRNDLERRTLCYGFFEGAPKLFKKVWAHHRYLVFCPGGRRGF